MTDAAFDHSDGFMFNEEHIEILRHTQKNQLFCGGSKEMDQLIDRGYMVEAGRKSFVPDMYYQLTAKGKAILNALESA